MIKLPEKNWITFSELIQRWHCTELDVVHLLIEGKLVPSYHFSGDFSVFEVRTEGDGEDTHVYVDGVSGFTKRGEVDQVFEHVHGFGYLMQPKRLAATEGEFHFFSDSRLCNIGDRCYHIPDPLSVSDVINNGVVTAVEIAMFEEAHCKGKQSEKPLGTTERNSLLIIIAALCKDAGYDYTMAAKTAGTIYNTVNAMVDNPLGETTIEGHLKKIPDALATRMK